MLNDKIKKDLKKCSRCALCLSNCPIYDIKKDENNTSRGLICKLNGFEKKHLTEKEIKKDFKICLFCEKCKNNCPSKINTTNIFAYKNACLNPSKINQKLFLALKLLPLKFFYFCNFFKKNYKNNTNSTIHYFKGCVSKAQHKKTFLDIKLHNPNFSCCGLPYLTGGDLTEYEKVKKKNIELIKKSDKVIFDCATCKSAVENYSELEQKEKNKLILFQDIFNAELKLKETSKYKNKIIVFHKPCHMSKVDFEKTEKMLLNLKGIIYKKLENPDSCCGFGGSYFVFHPIISTKIALKKAKLVKKAKADLILTICPSCTIGLRFGQLFSFNFKKTLELRDFIEKETDFIY